MCSITGYEIALMTFALFFSIGGMFIAFDWSNNKWPRPVQVDDDDD